ncbi:class I SAM-dependent methyltransferase [Arenibacter palladensis]|uniref:class I SAM-dependent methyltransferase n=1 Tax=Arenibacter palladensis TaxID=237373 RepID=UPI0026E2A8FF|nr:class I SAM-dependent methyltransferase [Arenibacter palladensis]MDO6603726.1 class I SAM-dependent methyltransferase [Arenibacter palladensis]
MLELFKKLHHKYVFLRRIDVLSNQIAAQIPDNIRVLDIGCGDGTISKLILDQKKNITIEGIDVFSRESCAIPFKIFDGKTIPHANNEFDATLFVDVLHHTKNIKELIIEASRVSSKYIIIKDHHYNNALDFGILKFMDWIGNAPHGVKVIYNFKNLDFWKATFNDLGFEIENLNCKIPIYPFPFNLIFGRDLHFITVLRKKES